MLKYSLPPWRTNNQVPFSCQNIDALTELKRTSGHTLINVEVRGPGSNINHPPNLYVSGWSGGLRVWGCHWRWSVGSFSGRVRRWLLGSQSLERDQQHFPTFLSSPVQKHFKWLNRPFIQKAVSHSEKAQLSIIHDGWAPLRCFHLSPVVVHADSLSHCHSLMETEWLSTLFKTQDISTLTGQEHNLGLVYTAFSLKRSWFKVP